MRTPAVALFTVVGKCGCPCGLQHLGREGVHRRPKGVGMLPFCAATGVKGVVDEELTSSDCGKGKMNHVQFD
jgi:hypothetical protein